ncbi:unnamed protein product [Leuciscus chuanchicus]
MRVTEPGYHTGWSKGDGRTNGRVSRLSLESGIKRITSAVSKGATAGRHKRTTDTRKEGWAEPPLCLRVSEAAQRQAWNHGGLVLPSSRMSFVCGEVICLPLSEVGDRQ